MAEFEKLRVWQESALLTRFVFKIATEGKLNREFSIRDQLRRAVLSIPNNIAEGDELDTIKQGIRHFHIAKGSAAEVKSMLLILRDTGLIKREDAVPLIDQTSKIGAMLNKLIQARSKKL